MSKRNEIVKTRRFLYFCAVVIAVSVPLALLGFTATALHIATYFIVYSSVSYAHLNLVSRRTSCRIDKVRYELGDADVVLDLHLTVTSGVGLASLKLFLEVPPQLSRSGFHATYSLRTALKSGQIRFKVPLLRRTGFHVLGPLTVAVTDVLGVFEVSIYHLESIAIRVPPRVSSAPMARWYGIIRSSSGARTLSPGVGVEYHSTREYSPEDELRHIDWKATARLGKLHVKVFEVETPLRVVMVLDALRYTFIGSPKSLFEYCADLAVALSSYLVKRGDMLRLVVITEDGVKRSNEIRNYGDLVEILEALSNVRWPGYTPMSIAGPPPAYLNADAIGKSFKDVSAVVIFSPVLDDRRAYEIMELAEQMRKDGVRAIVVAPLVTFFSTTSRVDDVVYKVMRYNIVSRELRNIESLRRSGVQVIALSPHKALEKVVSELERIRVLKTR